MTETKRFIEIAPDTFVNAWCNVKRGYLRGSGKYQQFCIDFRDGHSIAIRDADKITAALAIWRNKANAPLDKVETEQIPSIPLEIAFWLPTASRAPKRAAPAV